MASVELKYQFRISESGEIKIVNRKEFTKDMVKYFAGKSVVGTFRLPKKIRSNKQQGFYFGCFIYAQIDCFLERWGEKFTVSQVHDWNKANVWCKEIVVDDEVIKIPDSSSNKTTAEWEECLELCRQFFLLNFDWPLPYPETQESIKFLL